MNMCMRACVCAGGRAGVRSYACVSICVGLYCLCLNSQLTRWRETQECNKFGTVAKVIIATLEEGGSKLVKIFVQFNDQTSAMKAVNSLHKRWFGGKVVQAQTYDEDRFVRQDYAA